MNEKLRVAAEAAVVSNSLESSGMPARAIASTLEKTFHPRYGWIRGFEVEEKGVRSVIFMIASKIFVDEVERPENYSDLTPEEQDHILGGEFSAESIHKSGGHGYPANIDRLKANGYSEITREEFERRLAKDIQTQSWSPIAGRHQLMFVDAGFWIQSWRRNDSTWTSRS